MKSFDQNLGIVLEFASRVELYGDRESIIASLRALHLSEAQAACARALANCHRDFELRGYIERDIQQAPVYRRLVQLDEMIHDLSSTLQRQALMRQAS